MPKETTQSGRATDASLGLIPFVFGGLGLVTGLVLFPVPPYANLAWAASIPIATVFFGTLTVYELLEDEPDTTRGGDT